MEIVIWERLKENGSRQASRPVRWAVFCTIGNFASYCTKVSDGSHESGKIREI